MWLINWYGCCCFLVSKKGGTSNKESKKKWNLHQCLQKLGNYFVKMHLSIKSWGTRIKKNAKSVQNSGQTNISCLVLIVAAINEWFWSKWEIICRFFLKKKMWFPTLTYQFDVTKENKMCLEVCECLCVWYIVPIVSAKLLFQFTGFTVKRMTLTHELDMYVCYFFFIQTLLFLSENHH